MIKETTEGYLVSRDEPNAFGFRFGFGLGCRASFLGRSTRTGFVFQTAFVLFCGKGLKRKPSQLPVPPPSQVLDFQVAKFRFTYTQANKIENRNFCRADGGLARARAVALYLLWPRNARSTRLRVVRAGV